MTIYDFCAADKNGDMVSLKEYEGKVVLIINSATECGFTPQYDTLQDMYEKYAQDGLVILDFPCNQFGNQAPGSMDEIVSFCDSRYGITFPVFTKVEVNGEHALPLYQYLVKEKPFQGFADDSDEAVFLDNMLSKIDREYRTKPDIKWNFTKFLVDRNGHVMERFEPTDDMFYVEERVKELL